MTFEEITARKLFKEQIRRELITELKKHLVGWVQNGEITAIKTADWDGYIFVIPDSAYQELFEVTDNGH